MTEVTPQQWRDLPDDLVAILKELLRDFIARESYGEATEEIVADASSRGRELDAQTTGNLLVGTRAAVQSFLLELDPAVEQADRALYVAQGRAQYAAGRSLEELLGLYTAGAMVMWRRVLEHGLAIALTSEQLGRMAEAVFAFIHDLSAAAAEGYSRARSESRSTREARRERLLGMLLSDLRQPRERVISAAQLAQYSIPERLAVLVARAEHAERLRHAVGAASLAGQVDDAACVIVRDGDGTRWQLSRALESLPRGAYAGLGEQLPWREARASFRSALACLALAERSASVMTGGLVRAEDVPVALLLASDPALARRIRDTHLAPLHGLAPPARERLGATLAAWLDSPGEPLAVATRLGVHVQTVRYRMRQLHALFGDSLRDPDRRFEIALALRLPEASGDAGAEAEPAGRMAVAPTS